MLSGTLQKEGGARQPPVGNLEALHYQLMPVIRLKLSTPEELANRELCKELGITRQTLYRHVDFKGMLRADTEKLMGWKSR